MNFDPSLPTSYEYIHYTGKNIAAIDLNRTYTQTAENLEFHTLNGLWLSIAGKNDWEQYCLKNNHNLYNLKYEFQVKPKPHAKILILDSDDAYKNFEKIYGCYAESSETHGKNRPRAFSIRWDKIIEDYQGLALPRVLPKLNNRGIFNDTWCCTSACIWDLQAVEKTERLGTMEENSRPE